jgi:hypothetical protein
MALLSTGYFALSFISEHHLLHGGNLIWQTGTASFGFSDSKAALMLASLPTRPVCRKSK